jgi:hypothetical protein
MTDLSPTAQQVFWEFNRVASGKPEDWHYLPAIAAALRAVADQIVPETTTPWNSTITPIISAADVREQMLAIAAELEGVQYGTYRCDLQTS